MIRLTKYVAAFVLMLCLLSACGGGEQYALITTDMGEIKVLLYDSTPQHKKNFVKLVNEGYYDDLLFHRVMKGFMIQGGDPDSRGAAPGKMLGQGGPGYTIPAEIGAPHIRGVLAAARQPDAVNPQKASSGSQFYIVDGRKSTAQQLDNFEQRKGIKYNETQRKLYMEKGGAASLDGDYTVFGEVVSGMEVVDKIAATQTDGNPPQGASRPLQDVKMKIKIVR